MFPTSQQHFSDDSEMVVAIGDKQRGADYRTEVGLEAGRLSKP